MEDGRSALRKEVNLGGIVCAKLKNIYFPEKAWIDCYKLVANKFTHLKQTMRKFYPEKDNITLINELITYTNQDIEDAFMTEDVSHGTQKAV